MYQKLLKLHNSNTCVNNIFLLIMCTTLCTFIMSFFEIGSIYDSYDHSYKFLDPVIWLRVDFVFNIIFIISLILLFHV